jgi:hypothetical protein
VQIPLGRGSQSEHVFARLACPAGTHDLRPPEPDDAEDAQITLWVLQQLSYRRIDGIDPRWEEDPSFLRVRHDLERQMELELREAVHLPLWDPEDVPDALTDLIADAEGPSLSRWMLDHGELDHLREFVVHRAAYQLQEADPHSFAIPRLEASPCKTALLQLQLDEYGGHEPTEAHALLFGRTMEALELAPEVDLDRLPAVTLATNTLLNWLGRSRRLVAACLGHLAVFELTSVEPMARYAAAVRKLVPGEQGTAAARFYDVHVAADGLHGTIATDRLISGFVADHPDEAQDVLFGAASLLHVERRFAEHLMDRWAVNQTSLREPLPGSELGQRLRRLAAVS